MTDSNDRKRRFVDTCVKHGVKEVWINFDEPFSRDHEADGELVYIVPKEYKPLTRYGNETIERVFAPNWDSDNEDVVMSVGLYAFTATDCSSVHTSADEVRSNPDFKLLYTDTEGILFE